MYYLRQLTIDFDEEANVTERNMVTLGELKFGRTRLLNKLVDMYSTKNGVDITDVYYSDTLDSIRFYDVVDEENNHYNITRADAWQKMNQSFFVYLNGRMAYKVKYGEFKGLDKEKLEDIT